MDGDVMGERKGRRENTGQRKVGSVVQWRWTVCELGSETGANWPPLPVRSLAPAVIHPAAPPSPSRHGITMEEAAAGCL